MKVYDAGRIQTYSGTFSLAANLKEIRYSPAIFLTSRYGI